MGTPYQLTLTPLRHPIKLPASPRERRFFTFGDSRFSVLPIAGVREATINQTTVMQFNSNGTMTSSAPGNVVFSISTA